ncbi:MAG: hypothetical protein U0521_09985 [Anaerolineae bacterium]
MTFLHASRGRLQHLSAVVIVAVIFFAGSRSETSTRSALRRETPRPGGR